MKNLRTSLPAAVLSACFSLGCGSVVGIDAETCPDTSSDPQSCGACGHDCLGGACVAGLCQPVVLAGHEVYPTTLATDGAGVFWANGDPSGPGAATTVRAVSVDGSSLRTLGTAADAPSSLRVDEGHVYWYRGNDPASPVGGAGVMRMPKAGGATDALPFAETDEDGLAIAVGPHEVYWWPYRIPDSPGLSSFDTDLNEAALDSTGTTQGMSSSGPFGAYALEIDERSVFALLGGGTGLVRVDFFVGYVVPLAAGPAGPFLALDETAAFFTSDQGIERVGKQGGARERVVAAAQVGALAVDEAWLYYVGEGGIRRAAKDGSGDAIFVRSPEGRPDAFAVSAPILAQDDRALYVIEANADGASASILKVAK